MKKLLIMILALILMIVPMAFAEEEDAKPMPEEAAGYEGSWICDRIKMDIFWEEEGFRVSIEWPSSASESTTYEYNCRFNAADNSLIPEEKATVTENVYDENGEIKSFHEVDDQGESTFRMAENGQLLWEKETNGEKEIKQFDQYDPYSGTWVCGRATMKVDLEDGGYKIFITWANSASEVTEWAYSCYQDFVNNKLVADSFGTRTELVYGENGEETSSKVVYEDGEAAFFMDDEGYLIWQDAKEDAGKDLRFERTEIIEAAN